MSNILQTDGNPNKLLSLEDYKLDGSLKTLEDDLALVVQSASDAEAFIANKQYALMWRDADLLFGALRLMSVFENTLT